MYLNGAPLAQIDDVSSSDVLTYLHTDHLGTPRFATNTGGSQVWAANADAFGVGTPSGSVTVNLRMPGQYYDAESGLFYNWNRYYNPAIGRYISSDPIGLEGGLNTFLYAEASPVMYSDPEGQAAGLLLRGLLGGAVTCAKNNSCRGFVMGETARQIAKARTPRPVAPAMEGVCDVADSSILNSDEADDGDENEKPYEGETPTDRPENYQPVKGTSAKKNKEDGSIWDKDRTEHGGSKWKRWNNQKDWENDRNRESVRPDGSVR